MNRKLWPSFSNKKNCLLNQLEKFAIKASTSTLGHDDYLLAQSFRQFQNDKQEVNHVPGGKSDQEKYVVTE
jgi:hypothetical protein